MPREQRVDEVLDGHGGVQRPGCSTGNKNRRGSSFMLSTLLISHSSSSSEDSGDVREEGMMALA